jgi:hypothetical protein
VTVTFADCRDCRQGHGGAIGHGHAEPTSFLDGRNSVASLAWRAVRDALGVDASAGNPYTFAFFFPPRYCCTTEYSVG